MTTRGSCPVISSRRCTSIQSLAPVPTISPNFLPSLCLPSEPMIETLGKQLAKTFGTFFANGAFPRHRWQSNNIQQLLSPQRQYNDIVNKTAVQLCYRQTKSLSLSTRTEQTQRQQQQRRQQKHKQQQRKQRQQEQKRQQQHEQRRQQRQ